MADQDKREKLLDFLDRRAFDPVLEASPDDYNENDRKKLKDIKAKTQSTKKRYHQNYDTAKEVVDNFKADLSSEAAEKVHDDLRDLGLPTLNEIKGDFDKLAKNLGVEG